MSVYKRGDVWWYKFVWHGELIRQSTKQGNKRTAEQMEAAHRTSLAKGEVGIREKKPVPTFASFAPKFLSAIETLCASKPATVSFYKEKTCRLLEYEPFATATLDSISESLIDAYKQHRTRQRSKRNTTFSVASVNRELATLRRLLRLAQEWKVIGQVPRIRLLRGEHQREFVLSFEHEKTYLASLPTDLHDVSTLLLDTGLRLGEALSLECRDVHLEPANGAKFGYVVVRAVKSKNSKRRNVPLSGRLQKLLAPRMGQGTDLLFRRPSGEPLYQTWLDEQHRKVRNQLQMPKDFVLHSLRHTFGTRLGEAGVDVFTIMRLMGHSSVTVSQRYVHPSPESVELAFERLEALSVSKREQVGTKLGTAGYGSVANPS